MAPRERASTMSDVDTPGEPVKSVVYGLKHRPRRKVVYVGSTMCGDARWCGHVNMTSGCRRVAIALSRENVQPVLEHYELDALWEGVCTSAQRKAIEQVFMDKYNTRVSPRPTNGVTKDIDLFRGEQADQLNIIRSCTDEKMLKWARSRIQHDSAIIVQRTPAEERRLAYELEELLWDVSGKADSMACNKISKWMTAFKHMDPCSQLSVKDIHVALNDVFGSLNDDDGLEMRRVVQCQLKWFNSDKRGGENYSASTVVHIFQLLASMTGMDTTTSSVVDTPPVEDADTEALMNHNLLEASLNEVYTRCSCVPKDGLVMTNRDLIDPETSKPCKHFISTAQFVRFLKERQMTTGETLYKQVKGKGRSEEPIYKCLRQVVLRGEGPTVTLERQKTARNDSVIHGVCWRG